jgi:hypothetical protein
VRFGTTAAFHGTVVEITDRIDGWVQAAEDRPAPRHPSIWGVVPGRRSVPSGRA